MPISEISPLRQIKHAYASLLQLSESAQGINETLRKLANSNGMLAKANGQGVSVPALAESPLQIDLFDRLGFRLLLDRASMVDNAVIGSNQWEAKQLAFMEELTERLRGSNPVFIDAGSYWGLYSLVAARSGAFRKIYTFEADSHNFAQLQANLFLNDATRQVTAINCAVSDAAGTVKFFDSRTHPDGNRGGVGVVGDNPRYSTYPVKAVSLDDEIPVEGDTILMKIDVEGYEATVLRGMTNLVERNKIIMQVEIFEPVYDQVFSETNRLGLRKFHKIGDDHYLTNMAESELGM